jgi:hypothetical protein
MPLYYYDKSLETVEKKRMLARKRVGSDGKRSTGKKAKLERQNQELQSMKDQDYSVGRKTSTRTTLSGNAVPAKTKEPDKKGRTRKIIRRTSTVKPKKVKASKKVKIEKPNNKQFGTGRKITVRTGGSGESGISIPDINSKEEKRLNYVSPHSTKLDRKTYVNRSLDNLQGQLQGMLSVLKAFQEESTRTRVTGVDLGTKIRQDKTEGSNKRKPKEVKTGSRFNLQSRLGDPALKKNIEALKSIFDEQTANKEKKPKITTDSRKLPRGGDDDRVPKAIGESKRDQKVIQS